MKIIKPDVFVINCQGLGIDALKNIERAGRTCYKSEDKITDTSCQQFVQNMIDRDHTAMLEFADATVRIICDRGVSHELVRHRLFSFAQESTRYCNYAKDKFDNELTFIRPCFWSKSEIDIDNALQMRFWTDAMTACEMVYLTMVENGATPQEARSVLPNSLKTEIVVKGNMREWRHFFKLRCAKAAHPQMREVALIALRELYNSMPIILDDLYEQFKEEIPHVAQNV